MNIKGVVQKRGVLFTYLFLSLIPSVYAATSGAFTSLAQTIRDMLWGISEILSPFVKEGLLTGAYGDVYGRALLATIMILVLMIPIKKLNLFKDNQGAGMALAIIIPIAGVIIMPYNWITSIYDSWLSVLGMIMGLVIISLLKTDSRAFAAIKGAIYFAFIPALAGLSERFNFNDSLNMLISILMIICFILAIYNLFIRSFKGVGGKIGEGAGWIGGKTGKGINWVKDNYDWEKEKREAKAIGKGAGWLGKMGWKGGKWLGKQGWKVPTGIGKGVKYGYAWIKKRTSERIAQGIENIHNLEEVKNTLEQINIKKDKIEDKELDKIVRALLGRLQIVLVNERKNIIINVSDVEGMWEGLNVQLNFAIESMKQTWLSSNTRKNLENELAPIKEYHQNINELLRKFNGLRQRNIEQEIQQLIVYINGHYFDSAIVGCKEIIEFKKTIVNLEREFKEEMDRLYEFSEKLNVLLEKVAEEQANAFNKKTAINSGNIILIDRLSVGDKIRIHIFDVNTKKEIDMHEGEVYAIDLSSQSIGLTKADGKKGVIHAGKGANYFTVIELIEKTKINPALTKWKKTIKDTIFIAEELAKKSGKKYPNINNGQGWNVLITNLELIEKNITKDLPNINLLNISYIVTRTKFHFEKCTTNPTGNEQNINRANAEKFLKNEALITLQGIGSQII